MEIERVGNIIEGCFWIGVSLIFWVPALRRQEPQRWFFLFGGLVFLVFGLSDFYEAHTLAWWRPLWLLGWKAACNVGILIIILWYVRINGSWKNTLAKLNRPVFHKKSDHNGK
jgi:hypothetical protein